MQQHRTPALQRACTRRPRCNRSFQLIVLSSQNSRPRRSARARAGAILETLPVRTGSGNGANRPRRDVGPAVALDEGVKPPATADDILLLELAFSTEPCVYYDAGRSEAVSDPESATGPLAAVTPGSRRAYARESASQAATADERFRSASTASTSFMKDLVPSTRQGLGRQLRGNNARRSRRGLSGAHAVAGRILKTQRPRGLQLAPVPPTEQRALKGTDNEDADHLLHRLQTQLVEAKRTARYVLPCDRPARTPRDGRAGVNLEDMYPVWLLLWLYMIFTQR